MDFHLTVVENFLTHVKGDVIKDEKLIAEYLDSEWQNHFVKSGKTAKAIPAPK